MKNWIKIFHPEIFPKFFFFFNFSMFLGWNRWPPNKDIEGDGFSRSAQLQKDKQWIVLVTQQHLINMARCSQFLQNYIHNHTAFGPYFDLSSPTLSKLRLNYSLPSCIFLHQHSQIIVPSQIFQHLVHPVSTSLITSINFIHPPLFNIDVIAKMERLTH